MHYLLLLFISLSLLACDSQAQETTEATAPPESQLTAPPPETATTTVPPLAAEEQPLASPEVEEVSVVEAPVPNRSSQTQAEEIAAAETSAPATAPEPVSSTQEPSEVVALPKQEAKEIPVIEESPAPSGQEVATAAWARLLSSSVSGNGKVNYEKIKAQLNVLDDYLNVSATGPPSGTLAARAYWINQYNAYTIKLILNNWPVASIMDLHGGKAWDVKWIEIGGQNLSLNQIEFEKLRPAQTDARIHFAVNCAASSCPPLYNQLFTAGNLNATLERLAVNFVNDGRFNDLESSPWQLSSIFDWYASDFGDVTAFIQERAQVGAADPGASPIFKDYDWSLND
ncbi:MAG: DUF547 domain-containing protein [Bacteroidota bacterium]